MRSIRTLLLATGVLLAATASADAQCVSLTTSGVAYTQNFDTLANTGTTNNLTISGWFLTESGGGGRDNEQYGADTGGSNTGDTYSYGAAASTERALGGLLSSSLIPTFGACFTNNTGTTITTLAVAYTGEEWRSGTTGRTDQINFEYSTTATDLSTGSWTGVAALDFLTPDTTATGAKDGNSAGERTALSATLSPLSIANGATFWIRWTDTNSSGADDGLAVDDFSLTPNAAAPLTLSINDVSLAEGNAGTTSFIFTVSLSAPADPGGVTFDIATADNTATQPGDYTQKSLAGQTIPAGSSTYSFTVLVNGDATTEANETFFVNVTNVTGATVLDGQGQGTINNDDVTVTPIHDIQGPGASSPIVGAAVTTTGIVTGVKSNGFFLQEPDATVDADPATSEGVFVFTSSAPPAAAALGNQVQVTATVSEFVPSADSLQPPLTELTSPTVVQLSTGNPLPAPIPLTATFPDPAGPFDQLERLEGMRVSVASLTVTGPTLGNVNEGNATATSTGVFFGVATGVARPFREAGIQAPDPPPAGSGTIPPIPRFDTNPERIRVDSDGLVGGSQLDVATGAVVTGLIGPLDYTFRTYTILPDPSALLTVTGGAAAAAVTAPTASELTVASYNLERFFDTVNDPAIGEPVLSATAFDNRLAKASLDIRDYLHAPDVLGVVEVENLTTLQALAARISSDAVAASQPDPQYAAYLVEGNDVGGIDVGFLVKTAEVAPGVPRVEVVEVQQELAGTLLINPDSSTSVLNDRPPLRLGAVIHHSNGASFPVTVIVNHLRSLNGVNSEDAGSNGWPTDGARVRAKRQQQAEDLASLVQTRQTNDPTEHIVLVGDFNAFEVNDGFVDAMDVIAGTPVPDNETAVTGDGIDYVNPDLDNLDDTPPPAERYSYVFDGNAQTLDHVLVNAPLVADTLAQRVEHARINSDFPETARNNAATPLRLSDHDPVVGYFRVAAFASANLAITKTDSPDPVTAGTNLAYVVTVTNNGPDAADNASWSDTLPAGTTFVSLTSAPGWSCTTPAIGAGGTVTCSVASLAAGNAGFSLIVNVDPTVAAATVLSNTATVTSDTPDGNPGDESATTTTTVATSADLSVTKIDTPDPVTAGSNLTYTITVTNAGPSAAAAVALSDTLPGSTTFVSLSSPGGWSCTAPAVGAAGTVSCSLASFAPGNAVFTLTVNVAPSTPPAFVLSNLATVSSSTFDPTTGDQSATATTTVSAAPASPPLLTATKSASGSFVPGGTVTYTIVITNSGGTAQADNAGAELTDVLPASLALVSASASSGTATATIATNTVTWNGSVPAGGTVTVTVVATIVGGVGDTVSNQATLAFDGDDNGSNESAALSDDTTVGGSEDPTSFVVAAVGVTEVPTLDGIGLAALAIVLAALAARRLRRRAVGA